MAAGAEVGRVQTEALVEARDWEEAKAKGVGWAVGLGAVKARAVVLVALAMVVDWVVGLKRVLLEAEMVARAGRAPAARCRRSSQPDCRK